MSAAAGLREALSIHIQEGQTLLGVTMYPLKTDAGEPVGWTTREAIPVLSFAPYMLARLEEIEALIVQEGGRGMFSAEQVARIRATIRGAGGRVSS